MVSNINATWFYAAENGIPRCRSENSGGFILLKLEFDDALDGCDPRLELRLFFASSFCNFVRVVPLRGCLGATWKTNRPFSLACLYSSLTASLSLSKVVYVQSEFFIIKSLDQPKASR